MAVRLKRVRGVILDFDSTLLDSMGHARKVLPPLVRAHGGQNTPRTWSRFFRLYGRHAHELLRESFELSDEQVESLYEGWGKSEETVAPWLIHGARPTLEDLHERSVFKALLTARKRASLDRSLGRLSEEDRIDHLLECTSTPCDTGGICKPERAAAGVVLEELAAREIPLDEVILVGDSDTDIKMARAIDVQPFVVRTGPYPYKDPPGIEPQFVLPSIADLVPRLQQLGCLA